MSLKLALTKAIPDKLYLQLMYFKHFRRFINFKNPKTFNEKLQWLKLNNKNPVYTQMVDKYAVKKHAAERIGKEYIIPTLARWDNPEDIDFESLPDQFVLKWNHDSGSIVICKDKSKLDRNEAMAKLQRGKKYSGFWYGREWPYKDVKPCIIAEQYMEDEATGDLRDYKFFCFNGTPEFVLVCTERFSNAGLRENFYDAEWNLLPFQRPRHPNADYPIEKPDKLNDMLALAEELAKGIPFSRIDFYIINNRIYFGEITFFPASGFEPFSPSEYDLEIGKMIDLSIVKQ